MEMETETNAVEPPGENEGEEQLTRTEALIEEKMLFVLKVYPGISETMLQMGIGPAVKPNVWRPLLEKLIHNAVVKRETLHLRAPSQRHNRYTKLYLARELNNDEKIELGLV